MYMYTLGYIQWICVRDDDARAQRHTAQRREAAEELLRSNTPSKMMWGKGWYLKSVQKWFHFGNVFECHNALTVTVTRRRRHSPCKAPPAEPNCSFSTGLLQ